MKILTILTSVYLLSVCLVATGEPLVRADTSRIKSIAMQAIAKTYADVKAGDLAFDNIQYSIKADGSEAITILYNLPASAKHEETRKDGETVHTTQTPNISVTLSNSGEVANISKGSGWSTSFTK